MKCTQCGSDHTQRLEMIYDAGTQHISTTSATVATGYAHGELITGTASTTTTGTAQTTLAAQVAPPQKKSLKVPIFAIFIGCELPLWLFGFVSHPSVQMLLFMVVSAVVGAWGLRKFKSYRAFNTVTLPQLTQQWRRSWMCRSCGTMFQQA